MKRYLLIVLSLVFVAFATGCQKDEILPNSSSEKVSAEKAAMEEEVTEQEITKSQEFAEKENKSVKEKKPTHHQEDKAERITKKSKQSNEDAAVENNKGDQGNKSAKTYTKKKQQTHAEQKANQKKRDSKPKPKNKEKQEKQKEKTDSQVKEPTKKESKSKKTVTVSITSGNVKGVILPKTQVELKEGDTVLDVTKRITKEKNIQISVRGSKATAYVEGIDNLYEFDEGPNSGWLIRLDGMLIDRSAGIYPVSSGQTVQWIYTTNYLEDGMK